MTERLASRETAENLAAFLSQFDNPLRLRMLCRLACGGRLSVNDLADWAGETQSAVSRQLRLLWSARVVNREKVGTRVFYSVDDPAVIEMMEFLASLADRVRQPPGWGDF